MKNKKRVITALAMVMMLGLSIFMTACSKDDSSGNVPDPDEVNVYMALDLPSDSDNGVEWTLEQDKELFDCNDTFLVDEGSEEGSGEVQSFELKPKYAGTATLTFRNESQDVTYTYDVEVDKDSNITLTGSKGVSGGSEVDAPEPVIEKN